MNLGCAIVLAATGVVSFKDAAKIKTWDAWNDHKGPAVWNEKRSVAREKVLAMDPKLPGAGVLAVRTSPEIESRMWSVGCETLDRDYADWDQFKRFLPQLGVKHVRFTSGWAKTEQEQGVYDFTWLDPQIRESAAMGVKPWITICYGNPVYGSDFRLGMRVKQITEDAAAMAAWTRYVTALVGRYKDVVDEWEIWNEPFGQGPEYAELVFTTAKAIRAVQPEAKCFVACMAWWDWMKDYRAVAEKLKRENALDLVKYWVVHPYDPNPDTSYRQCYTPLKRLIGEYSPDWEVVQGEVGCPAQLEYAHALANLEWTEYSQAKWNLRRALGDFARGYKSNLFTFIDLQYTFMLQSFGLIRSNTLKEPVYRRPTFFAMQNVYSFFDDSVAPRCVETKRVNGRELTVATCEKGGKPVYALWYSDRVPDDVLDYDAVALEKLALDFGGADAAAYVWFDLMSGRVCRFDDTVPLWDSPVVLAPDALVARQAEVEQGGTATAAAPNTEGE